MNMKRASVRILSVIMLAALCVMMPTSTFAAGSTIIGFSGGTTLADVFEIGQSGDYRNMEVYAGDEIRIPLTGDMFDYNDGYIPAYWESMDTQTLVRSGVRVRTEWRRGSVTLDYIQLDRDVFAGRPFTYPGTTAQTGTTTYISIMFAEEFVSVKDEDFSFDVIVYLNSKIPDVEGDCMRLTVSGTMKIKTQTVDKNTYEVFTQNGVVVEPTEYVKDIILNAGNGVEITRKLSADTLYYVTAKLKYPFETDLFDADFKADNPEIYPNLEYAIQINSVNVEGPCKVTIEPEDPDVVYYVYGDDMSYLGTTKEVLPFSNVYFLSHAKILTFEGVTPYESGLERVPNYNRLAEREADNPNTGR